MKNAFIFGSGGHAKVVADIIEKENKYKIVGLIDFPAKKGFWGYCNLGIDDELPILMQRYNVVAGIIAIGDNWIRVTVAKKIQKICKEFLFITAIDPSVHIGKNVSIGDGTVVMAGVVLNSDTVVGSHCIVNTNSSLDHDNVMHDFCSIAPNVSTGGNVVIGAYTAIGSGTNIIHNICIGESVVVGAGAVVVKDIAPNSIAYGVPARVIRSRRIDEPYL